MMCYLTVNYYFMIKLIKLMGVKIAVSLASAPKCFKTENLAFPVKHGWGK